MAAVSRWMEPKRRVFEAIIRSLRRRAELRLDWITVDGGDIAFLSNTDRFDTRAAPVTLIHGLGADKDTWLHMSRYMTNDFSLVIPDLAGHGDNTCDDSLDLGAKAQALRILNLLDALDIRRSHIVGSSMGGAVAAHLAELAPEALLSLTLIDSYGAIARPSYVDELAKNTGLNPMLDIVTRGDYANMMSLTMSDPPFVPGFLLDVLVEKMAARRSTNKKAYEDSLASADLTSSLENIEAQALVIWGAEDKVLHVDNAVIFQEALRNCSTVVMEKTGHIPMVERPRQTAALIKRFISSAEARV